MDNVLYDILTPWISLYNEDYPNAKVEYNDFKSWDMTKTVCNDCGPKIFDYLKHKKEVYTEGDIVPDAWNVVDHWHNHGYELAIVTSCIGNIAADYKAQWLDSYFPQVKNRFYVQGGHIKHWLFADIMIDDASHNLEQFVGFKILFDQPWNQDYNKENVLRVTNWTALERAVEIFVEQVDLDYTFDEMFRSYFPDYAMVNFINEDTLFNGLNTTNTVSI